MCSASSRPGVIDTAARHGDPVLDRLSTQQQETLDRMAIAGQAMLDGLSESQREIADFVAARVRQDIETQQALMACRTIDDLRGVQAAFLRNAVDQYCSEMTRLIDLGRETLQKSAKPPVR
jgi:hypothetical protein